MREYELRIDEALKKGLNPFDIDQFNAEFLDGAYGFRAGRSMLELYNLLENPLPSTVDMHYSWPFPQFITGERWNFLIIRDPIAAEDIIYAVSSDHQTVTHVFTVDALTFGTGSLMEVADFGNYAIMVNGVAMVYRNVAAASWNATIGTATLPLIETICNFKGQAVGGGVKGNWPDADPQCDESFYVWSKIGNIDFTPDLDNEAGYRRCPYGGEVKHTRRLRDLVVGYSTKGITFLNPVNDPATFGFVEVSDNGILNKGAMDGSLHKQIYVGKDRRIYEITMEGVKELGYKKYMDQLTNGDVIVNYDSNNKDFYISDGVKSFLLSPYGMTEIPQHPSAVWFLNDETNIIPEATDTDDYEIITSPYDMGYSGKKTIFSVESDVMVVDDPQVAIDYYNDLTSVGTSSYKPINNQGNAYIIVSGNAFRFRLKFTPTYINSRIGYIVARYKMTDLRGIRGVYAPPLRGQ